MSNAPAQPVTVAAFPRAALTVYEFCATTSISRAKFYEEVSAKRIRILKSGRRTLVPASEVVAWLDSLPATAA
ncbi:MAG: helix-turn-helix domain-containing protein [Reyranella sp.]|uniref:helix-turn-helix transcriptional regulator n=1 Tax=Reyranella sp. TaxID=1929291 RepID=UPI001ACC07DF|nr:helix-turn-helix domain-containing protein [Reyranella sp.]MBN9089165.1 helix-turn-helix domain-containing protein [Reyranella sp.]